jgi:hypothetical protein
LTEYGCDGVTPVPNDPSPKFQVYAVIVEPVPGVDADALKNTVCPAFGCAGENVNSAVGVGGVIATDWFAVATRPAESVTVNRTTYVNAVA